MQCRRQEFNPWVGKIPLKKEIATHSRILAWRIPRTEEPGGLKSTAWQRVGHDWATNAFTWKNMKDVSFSKEIHRHFDMNKYMEHGIRLLYDTWFEYTVKISLFYTVCVQLSPILQTATNFQKTYLQKAI